MMFGMVDIQKRDLNRYGRPMAGWKSVNINILYHESSVSSTPWVYKHRLVLLNVIDACKPTS